MRRSDTTLRLPLALLGTLLLQLAGALWWAAAQANAIGYHEVRLAAVESTLAADSRRQLAQDRQVVDRLARIEERLSAQLAVLNDLKQQRVRP